MTDVACPVEAHDQKYSAAGMLRRYAGYKVENFRARILFAIGWCGLVGYVTSEEVGLACLALVLAGELVETPLMWWIKNAGIKALKAKRITRLAFAASFADTLLFSAAAVLPTYMCTFAPEIAHPHWEPVFTIYLLMGMGVAHLMFLPLFQISVLVRVAIYLVIPVAILLIGGESAHSGTFAVHNQDIAGVVIFLVTAIWLGQLVRTRHDARRVTDLREATQRRELQHAYSKLFAKEFDARRLAVVAETANDCVLIANREFEITWVNESFTRTTGYSSAEAMGQCVRELLTYGPVDEESLRETKACLLRGESVRKVVLCRRKDGQKIWLEISQVPMMDSHGELESLISVERDITAFKEHENELEEARIAAEEGERVKAEFLATMSHEIRTPLNGVIGMTQLLESTELDSDQRSYAETIHSSAQSLLALINDVLELSKLDARDVSLSPVNFEVRRCFEATKTLLAPLAAEKSISLDLVVAKDVPEVLLGDDRRITQILTNVVGNAIKFTSEGGVRIEVGFAQSEHGPELCFSVTDTGIGIEPEQMDLIFEQFSQADAAISRRFGGTGLGLTISQRLAKAMSGEISVSSVPGEGSCFTTRVVLAHAMCEPDRPLEEDVCSETLTGASILVADDNQTNRMLVKKFLKDCGALLAFAVDGQEAIDMAQSLKPDIILMDLSMPNVNGLEATRAIRKLDIPQPHIVALTANTFDDDRASCMEAGMNDFLTKPVSRQNLLKRLAQVSLQKPEVDARISLCAVSDASLRTEKSVR